ncbi:MAG: hypothetical protein ACRDU4_19875 [Mycobacterium sp.]
MTVDRSEAPLNLVDTLVAVAGNQSTQDLSPQTVTVVRHAWGSLLDLHTHRDDRRDHRTVAPSDSGASP